MFNTPTRATPRRGLRGRDSLARTSIYGGVGGAGAEPVRSRLGSVRDASPASDSGTVTRSARTPRSATVDEWDSRATWSRDERHTVTSAGPLPFEVSDLVAGSDFIVNSVNGHIDPASGFALVASPSRCVAWNYAKRTHGSPTVYNFEAPYPTRRTGNNTSLAAVPPALSAFIGAGSEPGLILVSATGEIRFWESVNHGLVEPQFQRYSSLQLTLGDDFAERLVRIDDTTAVLTTTASTAWRITIAPVGGRVVPTAAPFTRNNGMFSRASPTIFPDSSERGGIVAVAPAPQGVYLLGRSTLQKWAIGPDGNARIVHEYDLRSSIGATLLDDPRAFQNGSLQLDLNDLVAIGPDHLAAFVSYNVQDGLYSGQRTHNSHKIVCFESNAQTNVVTIQNIVDLSYVAHADPRMLDIPRLYIPAGSQTAFVRFADAIVMSSLVSSQPYEDTITLKDSAMNAFIAVGSPRTPQASSASLVAMSAVGGIMNIEVNQGVVKAKPLSSLAAATARIKSKIEQAVFFGDRTENPLSFDLPAGFKGDLAEAAEAVSTEIVASSSPYMPHISEIRPQLQDRQARLRELMVYIHRNGGLSLLPEGTRRRLCAHAEKVKSATELWDYQNRLMDQLHSHSPKSLLSDSIETLMRSLDSGLDEDVVRAFFRRQVLHIDRLLETVYTTFQTAVSAAGTGADLSDWVLEANRIFITALRSAVLLREADASTYQVDREHPMVELWTASDGIISDLDSLYGTTQRLIKDRTRKYGSVVDEPPSAHASGPAAAAQKDQAVLKQQMALLAASLCLNMEDKLRTSATQMNTGTDPADGLSLEQRWEEMKPRIIRPLVDIDRVEEAYDLAEHHRDYPTLVYLCMNPASSEGPARIEAYIERFGQEFAFVLYQWYIDQGKLHALLTQDEVYGDLLTAFFDKYPHPELSWMHDIACKRYGSAATALVTVDARTPGLSEKHLISSIAKLSAVIDMKAYGATPARTTRLNDVDETLDLINTEESLAEAIRAAAPTKDYPRVPSAKGYVAEHGVADLASRPAFKRQVVEQVSALLDGEALDIESLVDVLTLTAAGDAATAIQRLCPADLFTGRKQVAVLTIWRRVYTADDWEDIAKTAGRSEEAQRRLVEGSAACRTLRALKGTSVPSNFILPPSEAVAPPLLSELAARYPSKTGAELDALMADHQADIERLTQLLGEPVCLDERVRGIMRMVQQGDAEEDADGDVDM